MHKLVWFASLIAMFGVVPSASNAQNVIKDYVVDQHAYFAPSDYSDRGYIYRTQAGYSGCFNHCDDDESKRYSDFIYWRQRSGMLKRISYLNPVPHVAIDLHERLARLAAGAGGCLPVLQHVRCATCPSDKACCNAGKCKGLLGMFSCGCSSSKRGSCDSCDSCDVCDSCDSIGSSEGYIEMVPAPFEDFEIFQEDTESKPAPMPKATPSGKTKPEQDDRPMPPLTTPNTGSRSLQQLLKTSLIRPIGLGVR